MATNMTIGAVTGETMPHNGKMSRIRKVTFTHTSAGTAAGDATTTFTICGELLRVRTSGGDAEWQFVLNDGVVDFFSSGNLSDTAASFPLFMAAAGAITNADTDIVRGYPICGTLLCTTANVSTDGGGTAPTITVYWRESD